MPEDVEDVAANFINSNLVIEWTEPLSDEGYQHARIRIWNDDRTILLGTYYDRVSPFIWTAAENRRLGELVSSGPYTEVSVDVTSRSWSGTLGTEVIVNAISAVPATPLGVTHTWLGDVGLFDEHVTLQWNEATDANNWLLVLDGNQIPTAHNHYEYLYANNVDDHLPTLSGDYNISYLIYARNLLDQISVPASGSMINMPPPSDFATMQVVAGFSSVGVIITLSGVIQDFSHFEYTVSSGSTTVSHFTSPDQIATIDLTQNGTYAISVKAVDLFGQKSPAITQSGIVVNALTIEELRKETAYTDSISTSPAILNGLKDGDLSTTVITYPTSSLPYWIKAERPLLDRYGAITFAFSSSSPMSTYYALSSDDITYRWFAGPLAATGSSGQSTTLVEYANETLAQTNVLSLSSGSHRHDLPVLVEARYVKVYVKNSQNKLIKEFYPRRVVEGDDLRGETITGLNIAGNTIVGNHIFGTTLSAIKTSTGTLTIDAAGYIRSGQTNYDTGTGFWIGNVGGTPQFSIGNSSGVKMVWDGTNLIFRTGTSNQRIQIDSSGVSGYNSANTIQVQIRATDGVFLAAGGGVIIDSSGITFDFSSSPDPDYMYLRWYSTSTLRARIGAENLVGFNRINLDVYNSAGSQVDAGIQLNADKTTPANSYIGFDIDGTTTTLINSNGIGTNSISIGDAVTGSYGQIKATATTSLNNIEALTGNASNNGNFALGRTAVEVQLAIAAGSSQWFANTSAGDGALRVSNTARELFLGAGSTTAALRLGNNTIGFYGTASQAKQTVTGSRGGNAALASLLTALATLGLITNSSSA